MSTRERSWPHRLPARLPATPPLLRRARIAPAEPLTPLARLRRRLGAARHSVFAWPTACVLAGFLLALAAVRLDAALGGQTVPAGLRVQADTARLLLSTLAGVLVTVVAVLFWVRAAAVQLAAGQLSARVLQSYLGDQFQQATMGFVIGTFVHVVVVLWHLPAGGGAVPHLAVAGAVALVVASVFMILAAVLRSSHSLRASAVADRVADTTIRRIRERAIPGDHEGEVAQRAWRQPPAEETVPLTSTEMGWLRDIDEEELLASIPAGGVVQLQVRLGEYVVPGAHLARVWLPEGPTEQHGEAIERLRAAFAFGDSRDLRHDTAYGLRLLGDIAQRALAPGTNDFGAAQEAIVRLGAVVREVLVRDAPCTPRTDDEDRWLLRPRDLDGRGYIKEAFSRIRVDGARYPSIAAELLRTLGMLRQAARNADHPEHEEALREEAALVLAASAHAGLLSADLAALRNVAVELELYDGGPTDALELAPHSVSERFTDERGAVAAASAVSGATAVAESAEPAEPAEPAESSP